MFFVRLIASMLTAPLGLYLIYLGGWYFFLPTTIILIIATLEYIHLAKSVGWQPTWWILTPAIVAQLVVAQWYAHLGDSLLIVILIAILVRVLWQYEYDNSQTALADWLVMVAAVLIIGWTSSHFFRLRNLEEMAWQWTILAVWSSWSVDSASYLVGKFMVGTVLGKHLLTPRLSPNKTIEGYIGGVVLGTASIVAGAYLLQLPLIIALLLGLIVSIVTPFGDLSISMLKREAQVKDSGILLPGHGGALDRVDSLLLAITISYYLIVFINF